jgi:hypothetical protein
MPETEAKRKYCDEGDVTESKQLSKERIERFKKAFGCRWLADKVRSKRR